MSAITYGNWSRDKYQSVPVVSVFGGIDVRASAHPATNSVDESRFVLGGKFTEDPFELRQWLRRPTQENYYHKQDLAAALLAANNLHWTAASRLVLVVTGASAFGVDDPYVEDDATCAGRPADAIALLAQQQVKTHILHMGNSPCKQLMKNLRYDVPDLTDTLLQNPGSLPGA